MATVGTKSFQFRQEREAGWQQLEQLVMQAEKKGIRSLSANDVFELPHLYKGALSSLSVARSISLDKNVVDYLENLTTRAYFLLYGHQRPAGRAFARLLQFSIPDAVRSLRQEFARAGSRGPGPGKTTPLLVYVAVLVWWKRSVAPTNQR